MKKIDLSKVVVVEIMGGAWQSERVPDGLTLLVIDYDNTPNLKIDIQNDEQLTEYLLDNADGKEETCESCGWSETKCTCGMFGLDLAE